MHLQLFLSTSEFTEYPFRIFFDIEQRLVLNKHDKSPRKNWTAFEQALCFGSLQVAALLDA